MPTQIFQALYPERKRELLIQAFSGSEENVRAKFVVPLLVHLGFDPLIDLRYEFVDADVVAYEDGLAQELPLLVCEVKACNVTLIPRNLEQLIGYVGKIRAPYVMLTNSREIITGNHHMAHNGHSQNDAWRDAAGRSLAKYVGSHP